MFRRRRMPEELAAAWAAFGAQAQRVEDALRALLGCLPVGRVDPAPIPLGLDLLRDELQAVATHVEAWRVPAVESDWQACRAALDESLAQVEPARATAAATDELEVLLDAITDVVEPLDVWQDAERRWRSLRTRA